jgi:hypothetical protein
MSTKQLQELRRKFLEALPAKTIKECTRFFRIGGSTKQEQIRRICREPLGINVIGWVLADEIPIQNVMRGAKAAGIDLAGLRRDSEITEHVASVFWEWEEACGNGKPLSSVSTSPAAEEGFSETQQVLWDEADRLAQPVLYLRSRKSSKTTEAPVAGWNARLSANERAGVWLRVDLRQHPNERIQANGVLSVEVDPRSCEGIAKSLPDEPFAVQKGERPLFAEEAWDYPHHEILEVKGKKAVRNLLANDADAVKEYEDEWWASARPTDLLADSNVYAQLGGWPMQWPEEGADEQLKKQLVLRTYRDAEPWIEVFRRGRRYEVVVRIT